MDTFVLSYHYYINIKIEKSTLMDVGCLAAWPTCIEIHFTVSSHKGSCNTNVDCILQIHHSQETGNNLPYKANKFQLNNTTK